MKFECFTTIFKNHYKKKLDTKSYNNHSNNNQNLTASANARANNRQPRLRARLPLSNEGLLQLSAKATGQQRCKRRFTVTAS